MQKAQRTIVSQWIIGCIVLALIAVVNHVISTNEQYLHVARGALFFIGMISLVLYSCDPANRYSNHQHDNANYQEELQALCEKPWVVIYYGILTAGCILIASKAARDGVNPFEAAGINFIFFGVLCLGVPIILSRERKRFIDAGKRK